MKDKNGIEICCENCRCVCKYDSMCLAHTPPSFFRPTSEALEARIKELQDELYADKYNYESWEEIKEEHQKLEAIISDLKRENALLKDGKSHVMDVKMSPKFVKSIIRAINSEIKNLKKELHFTDKELDLIRNAFQSEIREDKDGWSAEKKR